MVMVQRRKHGEAPASNGGGRTANMDEQMTFFDEFFDEPEKEPKEVIPRKCYCVRSYTDGRLIAICPHHKRVWDLEGKDIDW